MSYDYLQLKNYKNLEVEYAQCCCAEYIPRYWEKHQNSNFIGYRGTYIQRSSTGLH